MCDIFKLNFANYFYLLCALGRGGDRGRGRGGDRGDGGGMGGGRGHGRGDGGEDGDCKNSLLTGIISGR